VPPQLYLDAGLAPQRSRAADARAASLVPDTSFGTESCPTSPERPGVADSHEQAFRAQKPRGDLAPGLRADTVDQAITLGGELSCGNGDISDLELDAGLGTGIWAGHWVVPKQAFAASERDQSPKCSVPSSLWVNT
jgi:hypothetical protein